MAKNTLFDKMFLPNMDDVIPTGNTSAVDTNMESIVHMSGDGTVHGVDEFGGDDYYFEETLETSGPITADDYENSVWADDILISGDESTYGLDDFDFGNPVG